jgi:hypothetical protein
MYDLSSKSVNASPWRGVKKVVYSQQDFANTVAKNFCKYIERTRFTRWEAAVRPVFAAPMTLIVLRETESYKTMFFCPSK